MRKTKTAFFEIREAWQKKLLTDSLPASKYILIFNPGPMTPASASRYRDCNVLSIFIRSKITAALLQKLPKLKFIATNTTGFDHIDLAVCRQRGIFVSNVPTYGENTVAEHTFALLLSVTRKIVESVNRTRLGNFSREGLRGFDLKGRTIGVVGTGNIGRHVIRMAHGFEMKILAFDIRPDRSLENHYPLKYVTLERLLRESDVVSLHAPYNSHTHHLINAKNIRLMKKGAVLLNTSRGALIETAALLAALKKGALSGAGLDVLEEEGVVTGEDALISSQVGRDDLAVVIQSRQLIGLPNTVVTPHNAFNSEEAIHRIFLTTVENIRAWHKGRPANLVK
ncbi:MAG: hydroxyacid dehydrogenase [Patescibacteria group bacterium]|nr:hydroxyacid dehydrogenase [Patescibacteria group bacterium]